MPKKSADRDDASPPALPTAGEGRAKAGGKKRAAAAKPKSAKAKPKGARAKGKNAGAKNAGAKAVAAEGRPAEAAPSGTFRRATASRRSRRTTFLVASTPVGLDGESRLRVFAVVTQSAAAALAALRDALGPDIALELSGRLSNRTAKALGLKPDEIRQV